jgi:hypothetical protein
MILMMSNSRMVQWNIIASDRGLENPRNPQAGKSALRGNHRRDCVFSHFHHSLFRGANDEKVDVKRIVTQGGARFTSLALGCLLSPSHGRGLVFS